MKVYKESSRLLQKWMCRLTLFVVMLTSSPLMAQSLPGGIGDIVGKGGVTNRPLILMTALAALALVPFVLIMVTSFVKIAVVLSIVRQAIGTQQIPPTQVVTGMAIILTVYIMTPVGLDVYHDSKDLMLQKMPANVSIANFTVDQILELVREGQHPLRQFLVKHAHLKDRDMFFKLAWKMRKPRDRATLTDEDFSIIVPAFVISELKEAFQIGFILFVPFLVIDMVVSNILMALGMQMLSPTTISLPFKVLLFVMVDGWYLITKGLVIGYQ
ncbi:MAG: EscR/YscR/HrcR family type III secretion system export apparatus protein [Myxococcales bacterium]|nr:EscR/YscR/HrcR family type III secretion system export apparatus protein [Myxococcales bacterium]